MHVRLWSTAIRNLSLLGRDERGQDLIEYSLLAAAGVVAVAAVLPTTMMTPISQIWSLVMLKLNQVASGS